MLSKSRTSDKFRTLSKGLLEAQTESQFHESMSLLESFIKEYPARLPLENWLKWWVSRKTHIFRGFKRKCSPESNLAEVIHFSCFTQKRTQLSIYEACVDDICEQVTVKQMLKDYEEGSFIGGTGPSFGNLQQRQKAREDSLTSKIIEDPRCVTSQNIMHEKTPKSFEIDSDDGCSPPRKKKYKKVKKPERVTVSMSASRNKRKESFSELSKDECEQRRGNKRVKRSADLQQAINNAKRDHTKTNLIDNGHEGKYLKWFTVSSANGRGRNYKVEIAESIECTCEFFNQKTLYAST